MNKLSNYQGFTYINVVAHIKSDYEFIFSRTFKLQALFEWKRTNLLFKNEIWLNFIIFPPIVHNEFEATSETQGCACVSS